MKEITDKLSHELIEKIENMERFSDKKTKEGKTRKYEVDTDWMTMSCWLSDLRVHLLHHAQDTIKHPNFTPE